MKLVGKLLDYVHSAFDAEPDRFVALRVRNVAENLHWAVSERVMTIYAGAVVLASIDLTQYTIKTLVDHLATLPGVTVIYIDDDNKNLSACSLIDGDGYQDQSNGDIVWAYQSTLWMYLDALSTELVEAKNRIVTMLDQMSVKTADNEWLDEWGGYFGVPRLIGEVDQLYSNRIIAEVIRPRENNKAIELALFEQYGQSTSVDNIIEWGGPEPAYNGLHNHDGTINYNSTAAPRYGLFMIVVGYDLLASGDPPAFIQSVRDFVEKFRAAGTHLDAVNLSTSTITDTYPAPPVDSGISLTITDAAHYNGFNSFNGTITYSSLVTSESL